MISEIILRYQIFDAYEPVHPGKYLVWLFDGSVLFAQWSESGVWAEGETEITDEVAFWAKIPSLTALASNYGKAI